MKRPSGPRPRGCANPPPPRPGPSAPSPSPPGRTSRCERARVPIAGGGASCRCPRRCAEPLPVPASGPDARRRYWTRKGLTRPHAGGPDAFPTEELVLPDDDGGAPDGLATRRVVAKGLGRPQRDPMAPQAVQPGGALRPADGAQQAAQLLLLAQGAGA